MPGHVAEDIAFVDFHGVGDLRADGIDGGRVECLDDLLGGLYVLGRRNLSDGAAVVVVGSVTFAAH
jgi:hypothetical protein